MEFDGQPDDGHGPPRHFAVRLPAGDQERPREGDSAVFGSGAPQSWHAFDDLIDLTVAAPPAHEWDGWAASAPNMPVLLIYWVSGSSPFTINGSFFPKLPRTRPRCGMILVVSARTRNRMCSAQKGRAVGMRPILSAGHSRIFRHAERSRPQAHGRDNRQGKWASRAAWGI